MGRDGRSGEAPQDCSMRRSWSPRVTSHQCRGSPDTLKAALPQLQKTQEDSEQALQERLKQSASVAYVYTTLEKEIQSGETLLKARPRGRTQKRSRCWHGEYSVDGLSPANAGVGPPRGRGTGQAGRWNC